MPALPSENGGRDCDSLEHLDKSVGFGGRQNGTGVLIRNRWYIHIPVDDHSLRSRDTLAGDEEGAQWRAIPRRCY